MAINVKMAKMAIFSRQVAINVKMATFCQHNKKIQKMNAYFTKIYLNNIKIVKKFSKMVAIFGCFFLKCGYFKEFGGGYKFGYFWG